MDQKIRKKIKKAIKKNDIDVLENIECKDIFEFRCSHSGKHHDGPNALLYACCCSDHTTIKSIIDRMDYYFQSLTKKKGVKKGSKKYNELEELAEENFSEFFYDQLDDGEKVYNAAAIARMRGDKETKDYLFKIAGLRPSIITDVDDLKDDELIDALEDVAIEQIPNFKRAGLASEAGGILYRPPRPLSSFAGERERQFLKHLSTMVYFNLPNTKVLRKTEKGNAVTATLAEIEMMHFIIDNVSFLFIAGNEAGLTSEFSSKFKTLEVLKKMISKAPDSMSKNDKEGIKRTNRYSKYIGDVIHRDQIPFDEKATNEVTSDIKRFDKLKELLKSNDTQLFFHTMTYQKRQKRSYVLGDETTTFMKERLKEKTGSIIFLDTSKIVKKLHMRHAEEFLVDLAETGKEYAIKQKKNIHVAIGGKKRPCLTCYARMKSSDAIDVHGSRPGFLWLGRSQEQIDMNPKAAKLTVSLAAQSVFVTTNNKGTEDASYDSGTESEPKGTR